MSNQEVEFGAKIDEAQDRFNDWLDSISNEQLVLYIYQLARAFIPYPKQFICNVAQDALMILRGEGKLLPENVYRDIIYVEGLVDGVLTTLGRHRVKALFLDVLKELEERFENLVDIVLK